MTKTEKGLLAVGIACFGFAGMDAGHYPVMAAVEAFAGVFALIVFWKL